MTDPEPPPTPLPWRERIELLTRPPQLRPSQVVTGAAAVLALAAVAWFLVRPPSGPATEALLPLAGAAAGRTTSTSDASPVLAHAAGAVAHPGVYRLPSGARVSDLIDAAGGPAPDADLDQLNLAAPVADGERVYVPRAGEAVPPVADGGTSTPDGPLNLNTATLEELDALPGVGPATAQAIIDERDRRGGFGSVEELLDVRGIGPAKLEQLRDLVTV